MFKERKMTLLLLRRTDIVIIVRYNNILSYHYNSIHIFLRIPFIMENTSINETNGVLQSSW